jgi:hypothetical protein
MSTTHGGKNIQFRWFLEDDLLIIKNEKGRVHQYSLGEIVKILQWVEHKFSQDWFPLANNVAKLGKGTEKPGLGTAILEQSPGDISHAQGSSYLGVVLEEVGLLRWNGAKRGIKWKLVQSEIDRESIRRALTLK